MRFWRDERTAEPGMTKGSQIARSIIEFLKDLLKEDFVVSIRKVAGIISDSSRNVTYLKKNLIHDLIF